MGEPIKLTFYDENDNPIKTYSRSRVSWGFFKKALEELNERKLTDELISEDNLHAVREFVCDFYDNQFTEDDLIEKSDVNEVMKITPQIVAKVIKLMGEQGINLPNQKTVTK